MKAISKRQFGNAINYKICGCTSNILLELSYSRDIYIKSINIKPRSKR